MRVKHEAPLINPDDKLADVLENIIGSRCRCGIVVSEDRIEGVINLMSIVRKIALEWIKGREPHETIERLYVRDVRYQPHIVFEEHVEPVSALMDMLTHGLDFVVKMDSDKYTVYTVLDALNDLVELLRGDHVGSVVSSQSWWVAYPDISVRDAFLQTSMLPTWRLIVIESDGSIRGIFSATDFLRAILRGERPYTEPISSFISTTTPKSVDYDEALVTAVKIMSLHNIYIMPVARGEKGFAGVVLAHDIGRLAAIRSLQSSSRELR